MTVRVGRMREQVVIQRRDIVRSAGGGEGTPTWTPVATVWARVKPAPREEALRAGAMAETTEYDVTIWHRTDVKARGWRLTWNGDPLNILSVANLDERDAFLTLRCAAGELT